MFGESWCWMACCIPITLSRMSRCAAASYVLSFCASLMRCVLFVSIRKTCLQKASWNFTRNITNVPYLGMIFLPVMCVTIEALQGAAILNYILPNISFWKILEHLPIYARSQAYFFVGSMTGFKGTLFFFIRSLMRLKWYSFQWCVSQLQLFRGGGQQY